MTLANIQQLCLTCVLGAGPPTLLTPIIHCPVANLLLGTALHKRQGHMESCPLCVPESPQVK